MKAFGGIRFSMVVVALVTAVGLGAPDARAEAPRCNEVVDDPTIATCSCICESGSKFAGCDQQSTGATAPTPNQCPDMLQGRRTIAAGDIVVLSDPTPSGSVDTLFASTIYEFENDPALDNGGLGIPIKTPPWKSGADPTEDCQPPDRIPAPMAQRAARMFDLPRDVLVTIRGSRWCNIPRYASIDVSVADPFGSNSRWNIFVPAVPYYNKIAVADFDFDGFDDVVYIVDAPSSKDDTAARSIRIFSATDTSECCRFEEYRRKKLTGVQSTPTNDPKTGDFNGDGLIDVAWIGGAVDPEGYGTGSLSVFFATICPGDIPGSPLCDGAKRFEIVLDPAAKLFPQVPGATSTIVLEDASLEESGCTIRNKGRPGALTLGNFENNGTAPNGTPIDELMVVYPVGEGGRPCPTDVFYYNFTNPATTTDKSWARLMATAEKVVPADSEIITLYADAARLDWYGVTEQAVIGTSNEENYGTSSSVRRMQPLTVNVTGRGGEASLIACLGRGFDARGITKGSAVGTFSTSITTNPDNPSACGDFSQAKPGDCPFNPQIALYTAGNSTGTPTGGWAKPALRLWNPRPSEPDGNTVLLKCVNDNTIATNFFPERFKATTIEREVDTLAAPWNAVFGGSALHVGDFLGNSVRVGQPQIARISGHTVPQMVVQAPPSMVDYVQPQEQDSMTPAIVNFTRTPENFSATVNYETTSTDTGSTSMINSHTFGATKTAGFQVKIGAPFVVGVDVKNQETWNNFTTSETSKQFGTYATTRLQTGATVGADDQLWWTQTSFNVFNFPVIGETVCPANLICDVSDPNNIDCDDPISEETVTLTCQSASSGPGCQCLSQGASATLCPSTATCSESGGDICCSQPPQQLSMAVSGPEEVTRASGPGATIEWYQPKHEVGQIFSYPSSRTLLQARAPGSQPLGTLTNFTTGTNAGFETLSWTCGTTSEVSTGTTTTHSFQMQWSLTVGTPNLQEETNGVNVSAGLDYQNSRAISTLNTYGVGLTTSSSVTVDLDGAGFLNTPQYAYGIQGVVLGEVKPQDVFDIPDLKVCPSNNPDCAAVDEVQADCTTTGPLTVAFTADPFGIGNGVWWQSSAAYNKDFDVALNHPSRWSRVGTGQVVDEDLQCRGPLLAPACYTINVPPTGTTASDVWSGLFYNMKGLMVTNDSNTGPQRDTARVGDAVFLQLRVYNYSRKSMAPGTRVLARIYRQQLDVNNDDGVISVVDYATDADGNPLPAVPIGRAGLGDTAPIPVASPLDGSATIPPFNVTTDPSRDNISLVNTFYVPGEDDACEYDNGVQTCDGAYYAYWVTVWAEDANGNVLSELPGHGVGILFDPDTVYDFITEVPLRRVLFGGKLTTFSNNIAMYKKVFAILPKGTTDAVLAEAGPAELVLDRLAVTPQRTVLGEPVVISAQVVSLGAATPGATVLFAEGDRERDDEVFDAEFLPHIRADDAHFVRAIYHPRSCGTHEIIVEVAGARRLGATESTVVDVGIDYDAAIDYLIDKVWALRLAAGNTADRRRKFPLIRKLRDSRRAIDAGRTENGVYLLHKFNDDIEVLERRGRIAPEKADMLIAQSDQIIGCVW